MIERSRGVFEGRNKSSAFKDLVWTVAISSDTACSIEEQTENTLAKIQQNLLELNSDKSQIVSAQVFISAMKDKPVMDKVWRKWIGPDSDNWPQRACLGVELEGDVLIEVTVVAVRKS